MKSLISTERLARFSVNHPWLVVAVWAVLFVAGGFAASGIGNVLSTNQKIFAPNDSTRAKELLEQHMGGAPNIEYVVIQSRSTSSGSPQFRAEVDKVIAGANALTRQVVSVGSPYAPGGESLISADGHTVLVPVTLTQSTNQTVDETARPVMALVESLDGKDGFTVVTGGKGSVTEAFVRASESDLQAAEVVGIPIAVIILVVVFGAAVAAGLPILLGLLAIVVALGVSTLVGHAFQLSIFAENFITTMGLAVGIDYSLVIVQRFREERRHGVERDAAIIRAGATATRSVLFSGLTVIIALAGLLIVPDSIFRSLAVGAIIVVALAIAAAATILPAVLRLLGDRVNCLSFHIPHPRRDKPAKTVTNREPGGAWARSTHFVMEHAVLSVAACVGLLALATVPYFGIKLGSTTVAALPRDASAARAFTIMDREFNAGLLAPAQVVVTAQDVNAPVIRAAIARFERGLQTGTVYGTPQVKVSPDGKLALVSVPVAGDSQSGTAEDAIQKLRNMYVPQAFNGTSAEVVVGGQTAETIDYRDLIDEYTPLVFAFVLGLSFVVLLVVFRSIVVPIKAMVMNLLSVGAAYGLMVLVFQDGVGNGLFGFKQVQSIEAWIPLFMFAVTFGLSMDYHVFLLSRIREHFDETHDNRASVAFGVRSTAGMITGAALIMAAVFAGFAAGQLTAFQQMGFGLAVAVLIDATIVRTVLVPASMALLGDLNWYLPSWLGWLPRIEIEARHKEATPVGAQI